MIRSVTAGGILGAGIAAVVLLGDQPLSWAVSAGASVVALALLLWPRRARA